MQPVEAHTRLRSGAEFAIADGMMNLVARNHCSRPLARGLHGHTHGHLRETCKDLKHFWTRIPFSRQTTSGDFDACESVDLGVSGCYM